ncbi:FAD-binding oxidoreductase [Nonomuraea typhae]|uniref:FAD-binding oxidoreductase n=1 Tax=Nonomuraea typhae TaxID=2603600 RepID=UPI0015E1DEC4|nr:FAD-binding oxidoreductase [Nonomuraea typhae]
MRAPARSAPDWQGLRRSLKGTLVRPGEAAYDRSRRLFNPAFDRVRPNGLAYCETAQDVAACLAFARRSGLPVTARSGGHSYAGWSTGTGLVIDLSRMNGVAYRSGTATIGSGARLMDVYTKLAGYGVSIPAGSCPTVGVGGLALGGGIGAVSRKYGLTCDRLVSVQVVTADGRVLDCDATRHPALFWACRGGGGGNFGVATSFTFRTHRAHELAHFYLRWPWAKAAAAVAAWQDWAPGAPDELWSSLHLLRDRSGLSVQLAGTYLGDLAGLNRLLGKLTKRVRPASRVARVVPYLTAMQIMAGGPGLRTTFSAKSHMAYRKLPAAGIAALVAGVARPGRHAVLLDALGGAVGRVGARDTAFPHRAALYSVQYYADGTSRTWLRGVHGELRAFFGDHAYVNYIDPDLREWRSAYYGQNAARLAEVKAAYDPGRVFRLPQGV